MTPREGQFRPDFDGVYARDKRDNTTPTDIPAAPTASGMLAVMIEKQPWQWDHVCRALCPLVIVKRCYGRRRDRRRTEAQIGENCCKTVDQPPLYGSYAC